MDFDLMITSFPKLLSAAIITLKLLSASLIIGLFINGFLFNLKTANKNPINKPVIKDADNNFKVITAALSHFGKLVIIKSKSIKSPYCI